MKPNRSIWFPIVGVLVFCLLCFVPAHSQQGVPLSFSSGLPFQVGIEYCVGTTATCPAGTIPLTTGNSNAGNINVTGMQSFLVFFKPAGTTSTCTFTLDSVDQLGNVTTGGIIASQSCTSSGSVTSASATQNIQARLSYNVATTGSVVFTVYGCTATAGCGAGAGSSVTVTNFPASQNVICTSGCNGTNASVSSTGSAVPASATYTGANNGGNLVGVGADSSSNLNVDVQKVAGAVTAATNPLYTALSDGVNGPAAVKAASTGAAAADKSVVVQLSPNQPNLSSALNVSIPANSSVNVNQVGGAVTGATNPLYTAVSDGANGPAAVKAASTGAAATDKSFVVQLSPNQPNLTTALNVNCTSGCTGGGGGASATDEATFTQGTTAYTPIGGIFNNSITNLASGQGGAAQLTADRNLFTNLNRVGGVAVSLYATLFNAQSATSTATSSATRIPGFSSWGILSITGSGITGSPTGCQVVLEQQLNLGAPASSAIATQAFTPGNSYQSFLISPSSGSAAADTLIGVYSCSGYPSAGTISVTFDPLFATAIINPLPTGSNVIGAVTQSSGPWTINVTQVGGASLALGQTTMSASVPVAIASNQSNLPENVVQIAGAAVSTAASGVQKVGVVGNAGAAIDVAASQNQTAPANMVLVGAQFNTTPATIANGNVSPFQMDNAGNLLVNVKAGSTGNAAASATGSAVPASGDYSALNVAGTLRGQTGVNPTGAVFAAQVDLTSENGVALGSPANYGTSPGGVPAIGVNAFVTNDVTTQGDVAQGGTDSGNPLKVGGVFNAGPTNAPTQGPVSLANGQRSSFQVDAGGRLIVTSPDIQQLTNVVAQGGVPKGSVSLSGTFGRKIGSTGDALDVNVKYAIPAADPCSGAKISIPISQTANTQLAVGTGGRYHVCAMLLVSTTAQSISLVGGTGVTCGTGTQAIFGSTTAANGMPPAANGGWTYGDGVGTVGQDPVSGNNLCLLQSGAGLIAGNIVVAVGVN